MEHLTNPMGFLIGLFFLIVFFWNVAMGEIETRVGAIRFDERPWTWAFINSFFLTFGFLACAHSVQDIQWLRWLVSFEKSLSAQSSGQVFWMTYFAGVVAAYALQKFIVRVNR